MLKKIKNRKSGSDGFTIIEVLIVLAIAGLILLIVFLAVPALQRSSRNTQRKNDASAISSAIANFIDNNGGTTPSTVAGDGSTTSNVVLGSSGTSNTETAKLGYYSAASSATGGASSGKIYINSVTTATTPTVAAPGSESATAVSNQSVVIEVGENCNSTNTGAGTVNSRTAAIFYVTETGSGNGSLQCVEQ